MCLHRIYVHNYSHVSYNVLYIMTFADIKGFKRQLMSVVTGAIAKIQK